MVHTCTITHTHRRTRNKFVKRYHLFNPFSLVATYTVSGTSSGWTFSAIGIHMALSTAFSSFRTRILLLQFLDPLSLIWNGDDLLRLLVEAILLLYIQPPLSRPFLVSFPRTSCPRAGSIGQISRIAVRSRAPRLITRVSFPFLQTGLLPRAASAIFST